MPKTTFYYPEMVSRQADGTLAMRTSWYDNEGTHESGVTVISANRQGAETYEFWLWLIQQFQEMEGPFLSNTQVDELRAEFERCKRTAGSALVDADGILAAIPLERGPSFGRRLGDDFDKALLHTENVFLTAIFWPRRAYRSVRERFGKHHRTRRSDDV